MENKNIDTTNEQHGNIMLELLACQQKNAALQSKLTKLRIEHEQVCAEAGRVRAAYRAAIGEVNQLRAQLHTQEQAMATARALLEPQPSVLMDVQPLAASTVHQQRIGLQHGDDDGGDDNAHDFADRRSMPIPPGPLGRHNVAERKKRPLDVVRTGSDASVAAKPPQKSSSSLKKGHLYRQDATDDRSSCDASISSNEPSPNADPLVNVTYQLAKLEARKARRANSNSPRAGPSAARSDPVPLSKDDTSDYRSSCDASISSKERSPCSGNWSSGGSGGSGSSGGISDEHKRYLLAKLEWRKARRARSHSPSAGPSAASSDRVPASVPPLKERLARR